MQKAIKNLTAERIVVGILLNHPEWLIETGGLIRTDYFFNTGHKTMFFLIDALLNEGAETIDTMSLIARAEKISKVSEVLVENGGIEYLEEIKELSEEYTKDDLKRYSLEVMTCSYKRDLEKINEACNNLLHEKPELTISDVIQWQQEKNRELEMKYTVGSEATFIKDVFDEVWQEVEANRQGNGLYGLPSKITLLNQYLGYQNGELTVVGARAKYGKSNWAINEIHNLAVIHGIPVAYLDTEMKTRTFLSRLIALDSGVNAREIQSGAYLKDVDKAMRVEASKERIRKAPIIHKYSAHWDKAKVGSTAKLLKIRHNIGMLIYDYIKVKEVTGSMKEHSELGNWTIFLKDLAGDLDIPILTFGQLSPNERRLADSDKINRYASTVAYLLPKSQEEISRDFGKDKGGTDFLFIDYNRLGADMRGDPSKGINLFYYRDICKFEQAEYQILNDEYNG